MYISKGGLPMKKGSRQYNIRVPISVADEIRDYAVRYGISASSAVLRFTQEGLRMSRFPGIDFRWTPTGRLPHVTGTGLTVWELFRIWIDHKQEVPRLQRNYPHLTLNQINAAVSYGQTFGAEKPLPSPPPPFALKVTVP
ncbi:MAG: hypothetical protein A2Z34_07155 [Planctomycetes bacterium RBG_16_59_8]|nr:MAG: hypothetical protein A2Z34_07155 [Planctomycetes bacterium RBG_16_59_8]